MEKLSTMISSSRLFALLAICAILAVNTAGSVAYTVDFGGEFLPIKPACTGSIAECLLSEEDELGMGELEMDSESDRRILATRGYISYGALRRNSVPCSRRGASYYNCRRGAQANPYSRGCNRITRCRR